MNTTLQAKEAQKALDAQVVARYKTLSTDEVKTLVVEDKWLTALSAGVQAELDRVSQALSAEVDALSSKVDEHLRRLGFTV